jgi:amino acid adenylation domain-containing protein
VIAGLDPREERPNGNLDVWAIYPSAEGVTSPVLSPQQRRLAAMPVRDIRPSPQLVAYIAGDIDTARLQAATENVFRRHAALRQRLLTCDGRPLVWTSAGIRRHASDASAAVARLRQRRGFYQLILQPHAGSVDSTGLVRALEAVSAAFRRDDASADTQEAQPAPQVIARYFNELLQDGEAAAGRKYWQRSSPDLYVTPVLARAVGIRTAGPDDPAILAVPAGDAIISGLARTADAVGVPVRAVILSAWRLLLGRIAPAETGFLGVFQPGPADDLPDTLGLLGRYVPVPVQFGCGGTVAEAVESCGADLDEAACWTDFFAWPDAHISSCGYSFGYRHVDAPNGVFSGTAIAAVESVAAPVDRCVVELQSLQAGSDLRLALSYRTPALNDSMAERLAGWLAAVLAHLPEFLNSVPGDAVTAALRPDAHVSPMAGKARRIPGQTLVVAFEAQARRTPDAVAARDDAAQLTYKELAAATESLNTLLADMGAPAGVPVAVCMQRRVPLLVAMLAVMRQGAYFVPLDPSHPPGRLAQILQDAAPHLLITDAATTGLFPTTGNRPVLRLNGLPDPATASNAPPPAHGSGDRTAYMIYTSGSTGQPKGIRISHTSLLNYLWWARAEYRVADGSGTLVHSSIAVDMTMTSLFAPLLTGQAVWLLPSDEPQSLAEALTSARALSPLKMTPGGLAMLTRLLPASHIARATRHLVIGGEQLTAAAMAGLNDGAEGLRITNEYGPAETTVGSCAFTFTYGADIPDPVPIGQPIWNTTIQLRAAAGMPCLPGTAGEIMIGGAGVARGYHQRPDETAARFLPAAADGAAALYRTGDIGRRRDDGALEMLGRTDQQVKIHGYRVEPAEVEAALTRDARVATAAVVPVTAGHSGTTFLSAFIVPAAAADDLLGTVRDIAEAQLPFFARPDRVEIVERLPLSRSGKVDRQQLVERSGQPVAHSEADRAGGDSLDALTEIWCRVLGRPVVTADDNFFASGADSIRALQLVAEARQAGLLLTVQDVLHHRTLRRIAAAARERQPVPPTDQISYTGPVPLTRSQSAALAAALREPQRWTLRWIFDAAGLIDHPRLTVALEAVHRMHPALQCRFAHANDRWTAWIDVPGPVTPRLADLSDIPAEDHDAAIRRSLAECEAQLKLDSQTSCLYVFRLGRGRPDRLAWVVHHLVCDVVSLHILTRDLWSAYDNAASEGVAAAGATDAYLDWVGSSASQPPVRFAALPLRSSTRTLATSLGGDSAQSLKRLAARGPRWGVAALVASLMRALAAVCPGLPSAVCVEEHGRDRTSMDVSTAVGWLTAFRAISADGSLPQPGHWLAGDVHRQLATPAQDDIGDLPAVALNYLGDLPAGCRLDVPAAAEPGSEAVALPLLFGLEVVCWTAGNHLELLWRHALTWLPAHDVARLADAFAREAPALLHDLAATDPGEITAPLAGTGLSDADMARILNTFGTT